MAEIAQKDQLISNFSAIQIQKPVDEIITQIKKLITTGVLAPGDKLPSERDLAERLGVGRGQLREALKKLEFYGILQTLPQSGTVVSSIGVRALEGLISNILDLEKDDFQAIIETRIILEVNSARLAAERATDEDIEELRKAHTELKQLNEGNHSSIEEDHLFHLKIAECSKNQVLRSLIGLLTPEVIAHSYKNNTCRDGRALNALREHEAILEAIALRDPEKAAEAMTLHMELSRKQFTLS